MMTTGYVNGNPEVLSKAPRFARTLPWIAVGSVVFGFLISALAAWTVYFEEERIIFKEFEVDVGERIDAFDRELSLKFEALQSLKVLFDYGGDITPTKFAKVARNIIINHKGIQALEWIPYVPVKQRREFEARRRVDYPNFKFTELLKQGLMIEAKKRDFYFPVYFVEPMSGNETAFGFDLASNEVRRKTLYASRDSGTYTRDGKYYLGAGKSQTESLYRFPASL